MKLSEAIKMGAALRPQAFEAYACRGEGDMVSTCALGAAFEALTGQLPHIGDGGGVLDVIEASAEGIGDANEDLLAQIIIWNDDDKLTREEIANRLEAQGY